MWAITELSTREKPLSTQEEELRQLMVRYQGGDARAVEELVRRLSPSLMGFLMAWLVSPSDAEDMLQECWFRIHRSRHTFRPGQPVLPWIFAIARHTRLDGYRRRSRRERRELLMAEPQERPQRAPRVAQQPDIWRLLEALPPQQREVIVLLKISGMSLHEVARATGATVGAVKQRAHRAYAKLRELLTKGE